MHPRPATTTMLARPEPAAAALRGRRLALARAAWAVLVALALGLFVAALPAQYAAHTVPPPATRALLARLGLAVGVYAAYAVALGAVFALGCFAVAAVIARRRSRDGTALFVSLFLALLGGGNGANTTALERLHPALFYPARVSLFLVYAGLLLFIFVFPDGRFVPRWLRGPALLWMAALLAAVVLTRAPLAAAPPWWVPAGLGAGVAAQVYRYARVSGPVQRQQTKWVVFGLAVAVLGYVAAFALAALVPALSPAGARAAPDDLVGPTLLAATNLLIPLSIGVAILKYRLWDIDVILSRALVYGALTAGVVGLYVLVVGYLGALFRTGGNLAISLVATGLVAVLFQPLRARLQRGVNRLLYGERDEPYAVLARLGQRLEATLAPDAVLPTIVRTVREALRLPYAAIALREGEQFVIAAAAGRPAAEPLRLPLVYQHEPVGQLLLAPRAPGEPFGPADRRLLDDLARQAGVAAHAVRLTAALQRSRERLVATREEERRRLRRDLHDGLGPQLAGVTFRLHAARQLLPHDPAAVDAALGDLIARTQEAVDDIRRLVYGLRPPALDDLGLVAALRETAAQAVAAGLQVDVEAPACLPPLPAAVEVALYRIAQEALTNVARHAGARTCRVRLWLDEAVWLEVRDDGRGLPARHHRGAGLVSMRERAAELGGTCTAEPAAPGGTRVLVRLPRGSGEAPQDPAPAAGAPADAR